jgi:hypothetical protein
MKEDSGMRVAKHILASLVLLTLLAGSAPLFFAQDLVAIERRVRLSRGKTKTFRNKGDSSTSYVYKLRAEKDRRLEARLSSEGGSATLSIVPPGTQTLENAAGVKEWSGVLPETGEYSVVVAMSTTGNAKLPYTLELTIR